MTADFWDETVISRGRAARFRVGPLVLTISRSAQEWHVARESTGDAIDASASVETLEQMPEAAEHADVTRYATSPGSDRVSVLPVVPDRSVVSRLDRPLTILARTSVTLYIGAPVWLRIVEPGDRRLAEFPAWRPKETWFGPNTREGELCYSTRTLGRLVLDEMQILPHRMVSAVSIRNDRDEALAIDRVNLPARRLSVYRAKDGRFWSEAVTLERTLRDEFAKIHVGDEPPAEAAHAVRISGPRDVEESGRLFRAFGTLFSRDSS